VFPNPDGDAKRIHEILSWFGQRRPYVQQGGVLYFLAPKCLHRDYKLRERKAVPSLKKRKKKSILLEMLILEAGECLVVLVLRRLSSLQEGPLPSLL
jgi:hypothetical protein